MDFTVLHCTANPLLIHSSPTILRSKSLTPNCTPFLQPLQQPRRRRRKHTPLLLVVSASRNPDNPDAFSWPNLSASVRRGSQRVFDKFSDSLKHETGFDARKAVDKAAEAGGSALRDVENELQRFRDEILPGLVEWNQLQQWKDVKNWEPKRLGVAVLYIFVVVLSCQRIYVAFRAPRLEREKRELTEAYMEALIPEPTATNVRKFKKGVWRKSMPKGLKMKKFIEGPNGSVVHDVSYVGEDAWDDDPEPPQERMKEIISSDVDTTADTDQESSRTIRAGQGIRRSSRVTMTANKYPATEFIT